MGAALSGLHVLSEQRSLQAGETRVGTFLTGVCRQSTRQGSADRLDDVLGSENPEYDARDSVYHSEMRNAR
jgi:hypothetical protein